MNDTYSKVLEFLRSLPKDSEGFYLYLVERGIKGRVGHPCDCPVARLLKREFPEAGEPMVDGSAVSFDELGFQIIPLPKHISYFVSGFDLGLYPKLQEV